MTMQKVDEATIDITVTGEEAEEKPKEEGTNWGKIFGLGAIGYALSKAGERIKRR